MSESSDVVVRDPWTALRRFTSARIALGRAGDSLPTDAVLAFDLAHAQARDAVHTALDGAALQAALHDAGFDSVVVHSAAADRGEYLRRPDRGRRLDAASRARLESLAGDNAPEVVFVVADGLSAAAVHAHALPLLLALRAQLAGGRLPPVVVAEQGRVALGDEIGEILGAAQVVVLIGERPGLSSPDSLGAYLTFAPAVGRHDAERNCVSNIRAAGLSVELAAHKLAWLLAAARRLGGSGVGLKDDSGDLPAAARMGGCYDPAHFPAETVMKLGTPLSPSALRVMLLGAGELGKEVIIALQRLGVEVIAVDRYANAPGHQVAHRAHVISMTDGAALRALIEAERPHLVVPEIEAIATDTLVEIEAEGLAEVIPTARAARLTMNREGIRRLAAEELGLPTSPYRFADSLAELQAAIDGGIGYPCIVKPVMSSSGKGQSLLRSAADVAKAWDYAAAGGRVNQGRVIVEGVIDFEYEITLLTVRARDASGAVQTYFCEPIGHVQVHGDYVESWQPQPMRPDALAKARAIAAAITGNLGGRGIFGVELFIKGDQVWFSEVSPRPHDTGLVTLCTQRFSEFELHARAILGLPVDTALREPGASAVIYGGIDATGIAFDGVAEALAVPGSDLRLFGKPEAFTRRRMGVAVANAGSVDEARQRAKLAASMVKPVAA